MNISNLLLSITKERALQEYQRQDSSGKALMESLFGKEIFIPKPITERVKTFEDALAVLGTDNKSVAKYYALSAGGHCPADILAILKLKVITEALNEGWVPVFDGTQTRYIPQYSVIDNDNNIVLTNVVCEWTFNSIHPQYAYLKSRELAEYSGKQFIDIWRDWFFA